MPQGLLRGPVISPVVISRKSPSNSTRLSKAAHCRSRLLHASPPRDAVLLRRFRSSLVRQCGRRAHAGASVPVGVVSNVTGPLLLRLPRAACRPQSAPLCPGIQHDGTRAFGSRAPSLTGDAFGFQPPDPVNWGRQSPDELPPRPSSCEQPDWLLSDLPGLPRAPPDRLRRSWRPKAGDAAAAGARGKQASDSSARGGTLCRVTGGGRDIGTAATAAPSAGGATRRMLPHRQSQQRRWHAMVVVITAGVCRSHQSCGNRPSSHFGA